MGFKFVLAVCLAFAALENGCQGGKGFGGTPGILLTLQVRAQVVATQQQIKVAVDSANTTIQNNIAAAGNTIDAELTASQNKINSAQPKTPQCENQHKAAISQINSDVIKNCDQAAQFAAIDLQVTTLNSIHSQLSQVYVLCPFWPPGNQVLCIQNFSEGITTQVTDQRDAILEAVATATSDSDKCIGEEVQKAREGISAADSAYNQCSVNSSG